MNQAVSSSQGRRWLTNLSPAVTSIESTEDSLAKYDAVEHLPKIPVAEVIEVAILSRPTFQTEAIHHQLQGIGTPAVSDLAQLKIPSMTTFGSDNNSHEIVFVNIPRLGEDPSTAKTLNNLADQTTTTDRAQPSESEPQSAAGAFEIVPDSMPAIAKAATAFSASSVDHTDPNVEAEVMNVEQGIAEASATPSKFVGGEIGILVERIIDRFPLASPTVLLFVGGEPNPNIEETCAQVASALASCNVGNVLLIDGDVVGKQLTIAGGMAHQAGLSEAINRGEDWRPLVVSQDSASFSFLPSGVCPMDRWNSDELLRQMNAEMKREFQFICVAAGDAHAKHAKLWCDVCDGSYLVVSLKNSNETFAKSAVKELSNNGARVLGCVVADAE